MNTTKSVIHLARDGQVNYLNYARLGYVRLAHGIYVQRSSENGVDEWELRRREYRLRVRAIMAAYRHKNYTLYGSTALQVLGVPLPSSIEDWENCHILVSPGDYEPKRKGVVGHRTKYYPLTRHDHDGFPFLHLVEHWIQLRGASQDQMIEVGDGLVQRRNPLLKVEKMRSHLEQIPGHMGVDRARKALEWVRPGTESPYETRTRLVLIRRNLPEPTVNLAVNCARSGRVFHLDMGYEREKLGVEYDGAVHVGDTRQMYIDANRRRILQDEGWLIITVTSRMLMDPDSIVDSVQSALLGRGATIQWRR